MQGDPIMRGIFHWFSSPPLDAPKATILLRLMAGGVFLWEGILKFVYVNQGVGRFAKLGFPFPDLTASFVGGLEIVGGLLILMGLSTRFVAIPFLVEMVVAMLSTKIGLYLGTSPLPLPPSPPVSGFWAVLHEVRSEYAQLLTTAFLLWAGPGPWSLDARRARWLTEQQDRRCSFAEIASTARAATPKMIRSVVVAILVLTLSQATAFAQRMMPMGRRMMMPTFNSPYGNGGMPFSTGRGSYSSTNPYGQGLRSGMFGYGGYPLGYGIGGYGGYGGYGWAYGMAGTGLYGMPNVADYAEPSAYASNNNYKEAPPDSEAASREARSKTDKSSQAEKKANLKKRLDRYRYLHNNEAKQKSSEAP
jgi:uncharacterized membrane protein YphA (DoxX/SURF4 family)